MWMQRSTQIQLMARSGDSVVELRFGQFTLINVKVLILKETQWAPEPVWKQIGDDKNRL